MKDNKEIEINDIILAYLLLFAGLGIFGLHKWVLGESGWLYLLCTLSLAGVPISALLCTFDMFTMWMKKKS